MHKRFLAVLITVNAALLAALAVVSFSPPAEGQLGPRGERYLMISGQASQRQSQAVFYVVNLDTARTVAGIFNSANNDLTWIAGRNVGQDLQRGVRRR